jgi:Ser-tRNA(Ala) deacylase AlaX
VFQLKSAARYRHSTDRTVQHVLYVAITKILPLTGVGILRAHKLIVGAECQAL